MPADTRVTFSVRLVGPLGQGTQQPRIGAERGRAEGTLCVADLVVTIDDLARRLAEPGSVDTMTEVKVHGARVAGTVSFPLLAERAPISEGTLDLYLADRETGMKQMRYRLAFSGRDGSLYRLDATTFIRPGRATWREQTTAYARISTPEPPNVTAAGILVLRLRDLVRLLWSVRTDGVSRPEGLKRFIGFYRRETTTPVPPLAT